MTRSPYEAATMLADAANDLFEVLETLSTRFVEEWVEVTAGAEANEFLTSDVRPPDDLMLRAAAFIGAQVGRVIEREAAEERLRRQALYDGLTGLPNRTLLIDRLGTSLSVEEECASVTT